MFADDFEVPEFQFPRNRVTVSECFDVMPAHQALAIGRAAAAAHRGDDTDAQRHRERGGYASLPADPHGRWSYPR